MVNDDQSNKLPLLRQHRTPHGSSPHQVHHRHAGIIERCFVRCPIIARHALTREDANHWKTRGSNQRVVWDGAGSMDLKIVIIS